MVSHGGKRDGAGRKSTGRSSLVLYVSSEEAEACKAIVKKMRSNELDALNSTIENSDTNSNPEIIVNLENDTLKSTIASNDRIFELYLLNQKMPRGKYKYIADTLNSKLEYDVHNQPWSEDSVKKAISKIKISKNLTF